MFITFVIFSKHAFINSNKLLGPGEGDEWSCPRQDEGDERLSQKPEGITVLVEERGGVLHQYTAVGRVSK